MHSVGESSDLRLVWVVNDPDKEWIPLCTLLPWRPYEHAYVCGLKCCFLFGHVCTRKPTEKAAGGRSLRGTSILIYFYFFVNECIMDIFVNEFIMGGAQCLHMFSFNLHHALVKLKLLLPFYKSKRLRLRDYTSVAQFHKFRIWKSQYSNSVFFRSEYYSFYPNLCLSSNTTS